MSKILNEKWINSLPDKAVKVAEDINIEIAKVIAERIKKIGKLSHSDVKKLTNAIEYLGADFGKITKLMAKYSNKGQQAVVDSLQQVADESDEFARTFYSAKGIAAHTHYDDTYLKSLVTMISRQTADQFTNLSNTLAYRIDNRYLSLRQMYTQSIDKAIYEVQSGTVDYNTAMRKTIKHLATQMRIKPTDMHGDAKIKWESGYTKRFDSHIRQNMIDGVKQLQSQILAYHGEQFGSDGVELSAHAISAPDHVGVQGRQFSNEEFEKMQSGLSCVDTDGREHDGFNRPISEWNCRHVTFPIIIGISERVHSDEQLQEMAENSKRKYKLTQQQRAMETKLRTLKAQRIALSAAGDEIGAKQIQKKINEQQKSYREFSEKNNLLYDTKRASVEGYRRMSVVDRSQKNGIINSGAISGARNPYGGKAKEHADKYYGLVRSMKTDVSKIAKVSGFSEIEVQKVKDYIFNEKHDLGGEEPVMFAPDYMMAESWQRLILGKTEPHDLTLLKHELKEIELIKCGLSQSEAHLLTSKEYNYSKEAAEFYDKIKKYND